MEKMAGAILAPVVSPLAKRLVDEAVSLGGVSGQIQTMETQFRQLQGFLKDADSRRRRGDSTMESRISEIRGVAYEMEDVKDTINYMRERRHQRRGFMGTISRYSHKPCELMTLRKIISKIEQIKQKIREIGVIEGIANPGEGGIERSSDWDDNLQALRQFPPHFYDDTDVVGFEDDEKKLAELLVDPEKQNRSVISIVGMGGLGKTTLARKVYNDAAIREHFGTFAWISVSQNYRVIELLKNIMKKVMGFENLEKMDEEELREKIRDFLRDKRYLVVMDDVWTIDVWRQMNQVFPNGNNGSRILLTTRSIEVARHAEPWIPPHELQLLNDKQSFELFRRKAFPPNQDVPADLEALAQKLAKKCGGLPLALVVLGGLLSRKDRSNNSWLEVAARMNWKSTRDGQECRVILGLSYQDLPYLLKPCFLYIAAFPEDFIISSSKLVRLWVAEGFIPQEQGQTMEDTARDWLDELVQRCMIQVAERTSLRRRVKSIRIHDMLRDFGLSEARKDGFLHVCSSDDVVGSSGISSHRAAFHNRINDEVGDSSPLLRTLLGFDLHLKEGRFSHGLKLLRVLDLEDARDLKKLPKQIGSMIHLRYLGLRRTGLEKLPSSIRHLLNLQTLDVRGTDIFSLPESFWKIRTLRHVYINSWMFLSAPIIGDHKNLQTLRIVRSFVTINGKFLGIRSLKNWIDKAFERISGEALEKMDSLVSLTLDLNSIPGDVLFAQAPNLQKLRSLNLNGNLLLKQQQLPNSSQFPPNLIKLILLNSELEQDPMPVLEHLPNIRLLGLESNAYVGKSMSCSAGGFPRLEQLILSQLYDLEEWSAEVGAMPSLTHLTICDCGKLKMLPEGLQHVTTLRGLRLICMKRVFNNRVRNEDGYKVRRIPSIIFEDEES